MVRTYIQLFFIVGIFLFLTPFLTNTSDVYAQRPLQCGQGCDPNKDSCVASAPCHPTTRVCTQLGCDPSLGKSACCRNRQLPPPPPPTQPVNNPTGSVVNPNPTQGPDDTVPNPTSGKQPGKAGPDCNGDGSIDLLDFNLLRLGFSGASSSGCDVNGNGVVLNDLEDFNMFRRAYVQSN